MSFGTELDLSPESLASLLKDALGVELRPSVPAVPDWLLAEEFPYKIERYVGRGGSGCVWKVERRNGQGPLTLKLESFLSDPIHLRERWENECAALARLEHPNLVRLVNHGLSPEGDSGWLAMEWIEGCSLDQVLADQGSLPFAEVREFLDQVGGALGALHAVGLVHRDVKPGNILRDETGKRWVLTDLGIALDLDRGVDHRITRTMERAATPGYSPPELDLRTHSPGPAGDQFSLAFTAWEMLTGNRPLGAFPPLYELCQCPISIDAVLRRALATDPAKRFADLPEFLAAFHLAETRRPWTKVAVGAIFLILLIGLIPLVLPDPPTPLLEPFPKHFQSGKIRIGEDREHFMYIDLTLQRSGEFSAKVRTLSLDPWFGMAGRARLIFKDAAGNIVHENSTPNYGVNGRFIFTGAHDRFDDWNSHIPGKVAPRVKQVTFLPEASSWTVEQRITDNQREFRNHGNRASREASVSLRTVSKLFSRFDSPGTEVEPDELPLSGPDPNDE